MDTMNAECKTDIDRLAEDAAKRDRQSTVTLIEVMPGGLTLAITLTPSILPVLFADQLPS